MNQDRFPVDILARDKVYRFTSVAMGNCLKGTVVGAALSPISPNEENAL